MVSISLVKRKYRTADGKQATTKNWYAQLRFSEPSAAYLRNTGTSDKRKAGEVARRLAQKIEDEELPQRGKPAWTLEGMFSKWIAEHGKDLRSGKDIRWQVGLILDVMGGQTPIKDITNKTVHEFVQGAKERGKSEVVINRCLTRLRATLRYASEKWEAPVSDRIQWKGHFAQEPDEKEMYISPELARRFVDLLPPHIGFAFAFSYQTGCRLNEMETLTWDRISFEERIAVVETKGRGKKKVFRKLKLNEKAMKILEHVARDEIGHPKLIFDGQLVFDLTNRRKHWEKARKLLGCDQIVWHGIRHTFGTETSRSAKAGEKLIGKLLGHSSRTNATKRYIHALDADLDQAIALLPDIGLPKLPMQTNVGGIQTRPANMIEHKIGKDVETDDKST